MHKTSLACFLFWVSPLKPDANANLFCPSSFSEGKPTADFLADSSTHREVGCRWHPVQAGVRGSLGHIGM